MLLVICGGKDAGYPYHPSYGNWGGAEYSGDCKCQEASEFIGIKKIWKIEWTCI